MSLLKTNEIQNYNGSSLTLTASTVSTSAQLNTGGNISVTGSLNVSDDSTTRTNLGLGTIATQDSDSITVTGGTATLGALTVSGSDSGDLVRITQTGSGNALVVEDSANPDSTPFVVDASGNVGIGTSPSTELDVVGTIRSNDISVVNTPQGSASLSLLAEGGGTNDGMLANEFVDLIFNHRRTSDGTASTVARIRSIAESDQVSSWPTALGFHVRRFSSDFEAMRIASTGNVGIGTDSPSYKIELSTDSAGKPSTNTWTVVSDERIKENIELADLDLCYDAVKNIPLKRFKWRDEVYSEEQVADRHKLGWIAQDVESVYPKAVNIHEFRYNQVYNETIIPATEDEPERIEKELVSEDVIEDCRNLNADQIYAAMYGAIQKLIEKVESQQSQIDELTARIEVLETT